MAVTSKNNTKVKRGEVLVYSVQERLVRKNSGNLCASSDTNDLQVKGQKSQPLFAASSKQIYLLG